MSTILKLIETRIKELQKLVIKDKMPLEPWLVRHAKFIDYGKYEYLDDWSEIKIGDIWARTGETAFMKASFSVPEKWSGEYIAFAYITGGEGLLSLNGKPYSGADDNRGYIRIADKAKVGEVFDFEIEIKTGAYWEYLPSPDEPVKPYILSKSELFVIDKEIEKIYIDFYAPFMIFKGYKDTLLRDKLAQIMYEAFKLVDFTDVKREEFKTELNNADKYLHREFEKIDWKSIGKTWYVGHSHIDVMWLWPLKETQRKVGRTFNTLVSLMDEYPEYKFCLSQVPLYKYLEKNNPETFEKIKKLIKEKRVEPIGGTWVENDTNLVCGESLTRQCLYGKRYMRSLGADVRIGFIPDVFGYSYALPQVYKKSGLDYFITSKLGWQDTNKFPYQVFWWEGLDGSKVLTYLPIQYCDPMSDLEWHREKIVEKWEDKLVCPDYLAFDGWGDGGGGPTRESLEYIRRMKNIPGFPDGEFTNVHDFFDNVVSKSKNIPTYNDELYFEYHRGTYTSQANNKKNNRKSELALKDAEFLATVAKDFGFNYPKEELVKIWETVLLNQFHDCLPGSSINEVYKDSSNHYEEVLRSTKKIINEALGVIAKNTDTTGDGTPIFIYNTLSHDRSDVVEVEYKGDKNIIITDKEGNIIPSQIEGDKLVFVTDFIPQMSYDVYFIKKGKYEEDASFVKEDNLIRTPFYEIGINPDGTIGAIWDNECNRNVLPNMARANVLQLFEDKPTDYDAWELEHDFANNKKEFKKVKGPEIVENGLVRMVVRTKYATEKSTLTQDMILYANKPTIDFKTKVDWHEEHTLLKVAFPVDIRSNKATYEIAYGNIERSTTNNTSKEQAQWEMSGHRWADLSEADYGVSILNDCKFGWDIKGNLMRLTLLRSPKWPDPDADMGVHEFTYSLFAHEGNSLMDTIDLAHDLNSPMYAFVTDRHNGNESDSFVAVESGNAIIDCVKEAEDDDTTIIRLYEPYGSRGQIFLEFNNGIVEACETNLLEEKIDSDLEIEDNAISFYIKPYEIRTFKVKLLSE